MKMFLLGFLFCYIVSCGVIFLCDSLEELVAKIYMGPLIGLIFIIYYPFCLFYHIFLRLTIKPIDVQRIIRVSKVSKGYSVWRLFGNIYLYYDHHAKIINKLFFLRSTERLLIENKKIKF